MSSQIPAAAAPGPGAGKTVLVLGATSAIANAYARQRAAAGARLVLVGRQQARLDAIAADLRARGAGDVATVATDLADMADAEPRFAGMIARLGTPDEVLLAYGVLGEQAAAQDSAEETRRLIDVNFTSAALWLQLAAKALTEPQLMADGRSRTLVVIGSVAGDRGRQSNYVYGAAKAGLDAFAEGLAHRLHGTNVKVVTVKPGFVDTPMTAHLDRSGPLWAKPEAIAGAIDRAVAKGQRIVYAPWFWRPIMTAVRFAPRPLFYKTKL
ncbi:SDR family NAD(P)-dependent oxidoreductase [Lichenibacterium minor]|uniref:SDR family NAD(P)-dependent oxidoreductase n=1 Tax=Lichenibacterium minor TaxID=2316528 RepID=A0A4Q2U360_9HYPH|nr:SDR family NAD(P)-dependent oxidoreductase [Lichenibacterium minor]RYC29146.1 SDR family NAD(P)-dependent oxidoreductase [Lichenibacterium minor]